MNGEQVTLNACTGDLHQYGLSTTCNASISLREAGADKYAARPRSSPEPHPDKQLVTILFRRRTN